MTGWAVLFACLFLSMYECLPSYVYTVCVPGAQRGPEEGVKEQELRMAVSHHTGSGN